MTSIIIILIIFIGITIGIGIYFNKQSKTINDFILGGRAMNPWITAFAFGTSYFSAVVFVGYAGQFGWRYGMAAIWIGLGNAVVGSLLAWLVMGKRTRVMTSHFKSATMPEFFEKRYASMPIKIISALIVFVFLIPYTASVFNGLSRLFSMTFQLSYESCVIGMSIITAVYVILGGYKATAYNDLIQGLVMLGGIVAVVAVVLNSKGGIFSAITELSAVGGAEGPLGEMSGVFTSFFGPDPINLAGVVILTSLGTWGLPQMVHKFYTIKDERSIHAGAVISTLFAIIIAGSCYFLGSFGRIFIAPEDMQTFDQIVPEMIHSSLPDMLLGLLVVLVLSASMSTLSSLVLTSSSTLTIDLIKPMFKKVNFSEKKSLLIMRILIAVFILFSVIIALNKNAFIADLMGYSWGALAGAFLAPFLYGLFWKKVTKSAVYISFFFAVGATALHLVFKPDWNILGLNLASPVNLGALIMLLNLVIVPVVSLLTPKMKKDELDEIFSCYN